jgi:hypothetical protein
VAGSVVERRSLTQCWADVEARVRHRSKVIILVVLALLWTRLPNGVNAAGDAVDPAVDQSILDAALARLLSDRGRGSALALRASKQLTVAPESADWPITVERVLQECDSSPRHLEPSQLSRLREAADDLVSRVGRKAGFSSFRSGIPGVKEPAQLRETDFEGPVVAWPPGYSRDGSLGIVRLSIPWSIHSADATYIFVKRTGRWALLARDLCVYV